MTGAMAYPMGGAMASPIWQTQCDSDATERDGTGRNERATKTTTEIPSVLDRSGPVDNGRPSRVEGWEERFRGMDQAGHSLREIAVAFDVSVRTVGRWRTKLGLTKSEAKTTRPQTDRDRAAALLDDGCSFAEAARTIGVTASCIRRWFPDRAAWTHEEAGAYGMHLRKLGGVA